MATQLNAGVVKEMLPKRQKTAHKGSFGRLLLLCGSARYRGAAALCAEGALRSGAGIVQLAAIEEVCAAVAARLPCCTFLPLPAQNGGISPKALPLLEGVAPSALVAGCGLGNTKNTAALVRHVLGKTACPLVLDADALNVLAGHLEEGDDKQLAADMAGALAAAGRPVVLTPHIGEMARLCGRPAQAVQQNQQAVAAGYATATGCVVVLKSHVTVVAAPGGAVYINDAAGNAGMAKGGSGDVLAGIIGSLLGQGLPAEKAAAAGVWLHAAAGDAAAREDGLAGLSPQDLPRQVGMVLKGLGR